MRQTKAHSSSETGCTDSLEFLTRAISASFGSAFISPSVTGFGKAPTAQTSTQFQRPVGSVELGMNFVDHPHDADDLLLMNRVVEKAQIAALHGAHIFLRESVAHAAPLFAARPGFKLVAPGEGSRLGFEQPIGHAPQPAVFIRLRESPRRCA